MADVAITPLTVSRTATTSFPAGVVASLADTHTVSNDGNTVLHFRNTNVATYTATVAVRGTVDGLTPSGRSYIVPATTGHIIVGPYPVAQYGSTLRVTYTGTVTDSQVNAVRLSK